MLLVWVVFSGFIGCDFHRRSMSAPILTRPTWVPRGVMQLLRQERVFLLLCHSNTVVLFAAAAAPDNIMWRLAAACVLSLYQLAESSCTHSHRDYAAVYCAWALALLPPALAHGVALGVCVHFIASSGFAKLVIAPASPLPASL